jgi:hypothetical protein
MKDTGVTFIPSSLADDERKKAEKIESEIFSKESWNFFKEGELP